MDTGEAHLEPAMRVDDSRESAERQAARYTGHVQSRQHQVGGGRHHARELIVAARMDPLPSVVARVVRKRNLEGSRVDEQLA